jgi:N-acetylglucosamine kinase-like BadF-type ATPase
MSGLIAVDAGQTGIRLRFVGSGGVLEHRTPGVLTDHPLLPQLAEAITTFAAANALDDVAVGVGASGITVPDAADLLSLLGELDVTRVALAHDATTSYLGALGDQPGAIIAAGTGVVTLAVGATAVSRVDGWGCLLGDAGSAFWIGQAGLKAAMRAFDHRGEATVLLEQLEAEYGDPTQAYISLQCDPRWVSRVAGFAAAVDAAAAAGDPVADHILSEAAAELSDSVIAALREVDLMGSEPPTVCTLGGVFDSPRVTQRFASYLRLHWRELDVAPPAGTGLDGAQATLSLDPASPLADLVSIAWR